MSDGFAAGLVSSAICVSMLAMLAMKEKREREKWTESNGPDLSLVVL